MWGLLAMNATASERSISITVNIICSKAIDILYLSLTKWEGGLFISYFYSFFFFFPLLYSVYAHKLEIDSIQERNIPLTIISPYLQALIQAYLYNNNN